MRTAGQLLLLLRLEADTLGWNTMKDTLEQFAKLKRQLTAERETITERLAAINAVLAEQTTIQTAPQETPANISPAARASRRGTGKLTLAQAVLDAFGEKGTGLTIPQLLPLVQAIAGKTHKVNRVTVNLACLRLRDTGKLKNPKRGLYTLPWPPSRRDDTTDDAPDRLSEIQRVQAAVLPRLAITRWGRRWTARTKNKNFASHPTYQQKPNRNRKAHAKPLWGSVSGLVKMPALTICQLRAAVEPQWSANGWCACC
jgi:hypothetical protein